MSDEEEPLEEPTEVMEAPEEEPSSRRAAGPRPLHKDPLVMGGAATAIIAAGVYFAFFAGPSGPPVVERPEVAGFARLEGGVSVREEVATEWDKAEMDRRLHVRDQVRTDAGAGAEVAFDNGNVVRVLPSSVVLITDPTTSMAGGGSAWTIESGEANFDLQQGAEITTPGATTSGVAGTVGNIDVSQDGITGIRIFEGSATVATTKGETINLERNQGVRVDADGVAGDKQDLPDPPELTAPPREALVVYAEGQGGSTQLAWTPVPRGITYQVAMDYNVEQAELLLSAALDREGVEESSLQMDRLDRGAYFWRVAAVNSEGMAGAFSRVWQFSVSDPPPPPPQAPLAIAESAGLGAIVHVAGRVPPGSEVTLDGHPVLVLPDGSFSEYLRRPAGSVVQVRATAPDGSLTEESWPVSDSTGGD